MFKFFPAKFLVICSLALSHLLATDFDTDSRHLLVRNVSKQYSEAIKQRQARLKTKYHAIALIDLAREQLEQPIYGPSNYDPSTPDWSAIIRLVVSGYGYRNGVCKTEVASPDEAEILRKSYVLSHVYQVAKNSDEPIQLNELYSPKGGGTNLSHHVESLNNATKVAIPTEAYELVRTNVTCSRLGHWSAHERFYGVAGVINPSIKAGELHDLTAKLSEAIKRSAPVIELVSLSQAIQLTLAASPSKNSWETIRKALFLALSVTSNPETAGNTFLSTLYDCGRFYPQKTDPDLVKAYYWRLEAYGKIFSKLWKNEPLNDIVNQADPLAFFSKSNRSITERGASYSILQKAYQSALASSGNRGELALNLNLKHADAFRDLNPELFPWVNYHSPSAMAESLATDGLTELKLGIKPQAIHLVYQNSKWCLKALRLDSTGKTTQEEKTLWTQGSAKERFTRYIDNEDGRHLFNFEVDGPNAIIKAISTGYMIRIGGDGANVSVADGKELGIVESSAYPLNPDDSANSGEEYDSAILIKGANYNGMRGILSASRNSAWVVAKAINLSYSDEYELLLNNNKFFSPKGDGVQAYKDVVFVSNNINTSNSIVKAGNNLYFVTSEGGAASIHAHGGLIQAGNNLVLDTGDLCLDTQIVFLGNEQYETWRGGNVSPEVLDKLKASPLLPNSAMTSLKYGRNLIYNAGGVNVLSNKERDALLKGPHVYGKAGGFNIMQPSFTNYFLPTVTGLSSGRRNNDGFPGNPGIPTPINESRAAQEIRSGYQNTSDNLRFNEINAGVSTSGSGVNFHGNVSFASNGGLTTIGVLGNSRLLQASSMYIPTTMTQSLQNWVNPAQQNSALDLHKISSAAIHMMTADKKLSIVPLALPIIYYGGALITAGVLAKYGAEKTREILGRERTSGATGGMQPEDPNEKDKKSHTKLKDGDTLSEHDALVEAEKFLGKNYTQAEKGRYVSADGLRQFRMGDKDLMGHRGGKGHMHLEDLEMNPLTGKMWVQPGGNRHIFFK